METAVAGLHLSAKARKEAQDYLDAMRQHAGDKLYNRLGWMTRAHPFILDGRRLIVPLYHDGYSCSLMAITDDWGEKLAHQRAVDRRPATSSPASCAARTVRFTRSCATTAPRPSASSKANPATAAKPGRRSPTATCPTRARAPKSSALRNGHWVLIGNDTEQGRNSLAVQISDDEGRTWKWKRHLEYDAPGPEAGSYHYPSIIQAKDGTLHASYSYQLAKKGLPKDVDGDPAAKSIKHAHFNEAWVMQVMPVERLANGNNKNTNG